jgi:hypothetical protein
MRVWKVNPNKYGDLFASPNQGEEIIQGEITTQEVCITIEEDSRWMATTEATPFHFLLTISQNNFSLLSMC